MIGSMNGRGSDSFASTAPWPSERARLRRPLRAIFKLFDCRHIALSHTHALDEIEIGVLPESRRLRHGKVAVLRNDLFTERRLGEVAVVMLDRNLEHALRAHVDRCEQTGPEIR